MDHPTIQRGTLSPFALQRLGEMLRGWYQLPTTLPCGVYDLVMKLDQRGHRMSEPREPDERPETRFPSITLDEQGLPASKESDYRRQAVETLRLAQRASSSFVKARLVNLAEAWIELAEMAHKASRSFRSQPSKSG
jgi:hypothetical protein